MRQLLSRSDSLIKHCIPSSLRRGQLPLYCLRLWVGCVVAWSWPQREATTTAASLSQEGLSLRQVSISIANVSENHSYRSSGGQTPPKLKHEYTNHNIDTPWFQNHTRISRHKLRTLSMRQMQLVPMLLTISLIQWSMSPRGSTLRCQVTKKRRMWWTKF